MEDLGRALAREEKDARIAEIEGLMNQPGFWDDSKTSASLMKEMKSLKGDIERFDKINTSFEDLNTLLQMAEEENDEELAQEVEDEFASFKTAYDDYRVSTLLSGEFDNLDAILSLNAGAGGTESCDWASMLYRMYCRWAERHGFKYEVLEYLDGDEAGIKSVTIQI
ncbi:MAG: PCRF domain-containing protein, partial [Lachnospiraceae bacterium]|nr:PCRF domain-containing protein [Lachnospiraceae bacterium]